MHSKDTQQIENANKILVNVMFCASPYQLIRKKLDIKNLYFYTIYCLEIPDSSMYIIFFKIFKHSKRKTKNGECVKIIDAQTLSFNDQHTASSYLSNFINNWEDHERLVINSPDFNETSPAGDTLVIINEWEETALLNIKRINC